MPSPRTAPMHLPEKPAAPTPTPPLQHKHTGRGASDGGAQLTGAPHRSAPHESARRALAAAAKPFRRARGAVELGLTAALAREPPGVARPAPKPQASARLSFSANVAATPGTPPTPWPARPLFAEPCARILHQVAFRCEIYKPPGPAHERPPAATVGCNACPSPRIGAPRQLSSSCQPDACFRRHERPAQPARCDRPRPWPPIGPKALRATALVSRRDRPPRAACMTHLRPPVIQRPQRALSPPAGRNDVANPSLCARPVI